MFGRIRCHFCGSRQPHGRSTTQFQCSNCEAINYLDGRGNIVDTPHHAASPPPEPSQERLQQKPFQSFTRHLPESLQHQQKPTFCRKCTQNQYMHNQILADYLPDDEHPTYRERMKGLATYKKELEERYPLVCKECAPMAQGRIERADYYGLTQNTARLVSQTKKRGGQAASRTRDSAGKKVMRNSLRLIAFVLYLGLLAQIAFHLYGILSAVLDTAQLQPEFMDATSVPIPPLSLECAQQTLSLRFDQPCYDIFSPLIPRTITLAAVFLWFNPGLKMWYHHTSRIEAVKGQKNYFYMQLIILAIRSMAWYNLSDSTRTAKLEKDKIVAMHGFAILSILISQAVANRSIQSVAWKIKGKMMPKPNNIDVLGVSAGPADEHFTPKPSSKDPWRYLKQDDDGPLDINNLAPKQRQSAPPVFRAPTYMNYPPSPEFSDYDENDDRMETDNAPVMRSSQRYISQTRPRLEPTTSHTNTPYLGLSSASGELLSAEYQLRLSEDRYPQEQQQQQQQQSFKAPSPFYGTLPPAPMSMERRLRNPTLTPIPPPQQIPLSQQKDFMAQMRRGVKPVQFPGKGSNFELKKGSWVLPSDVKEVGLEERFMNSFGLGEESPDKTRKKGFGFW